MALYDITITRTGGIAVEADSVENATEQYNCMSIHEIEAQAQPTGWEASDACLLTKE